MSKETFGVLLQASYDGFEAAYNQAKEEGFKPESSLQEGSKERVKAVYDALTRVYGQIDFENLPPIALHSAVGLLFQLRDTVQGLESFASAKPEDFAELSETL